MLFIFWFYEGQYATVEEARAIHKKLIEKIEL